MNRRNFITSLGFGVVATPLIATSIQEVSQSLAQDSIVLNQDIVPSDHLVNKYGYMKVSCPQFIHNAQSYCVKSCKLPFTASWKLGDDVDIIVEESLKYGKYVLKMNCVYVVWMCPTWENPTKCSMVIRGATVK